tara:strand:+ start:617 stop:2149 length:1533 start_codon:yes stop_codon:yes gene_type:complete
MKNQRIYTIIIITLFFLNSCSTVDHNNKNHDKLNVLFIIADDLNCDLGAYGHPLVKTPNIDHLANNGFTFLNAHNQYPLCGPSRASFMTGLYTNQTNITQNNVLIRNAIPDVITLGQRFRQQGYQSVRIGKIFHYDNPSAIGTSGADDIYSWDQTINPYGRDKLEEYKINTLSERRYGGTLSWLAADGTDKEQTDGIGASEAIKMIEKFANNSQQFFLAVGFFRPHTPFVAPKKYFDFYNREEMVIQKSSDDYLKTIPIPAAKTIRAKYNQLDLDVDLAKEIKEAYYSTVSFVDAQVGRVLQKLKETGLDKNTIVVFTSDHGYHLGEHGHWQKLTLFENSTRIPIIIYAPNIEGGKKIKSPVELLDLYPTLMDLTDIKTPKHVVGRSLKPILVGEKSEVRKNALTRLNNGYSMKTNLHRITMWGNNGEFGFELYDHLSDPNELINLANNFEYKPLLDSLTIVLNERIKNANKIPDELGRRIDNPKAINKAPNMTFGDIHDENGKRTKLKK